MILVFKFRGIYRSAKRRRFSFLYYIYYINIKPSRWGDLPGHSRGNKE